MARKLEAQFEGQYLMSRVLITSTMKSEPGTPPMRGNSFGVPVSAAATCQVGGSAEGTRAGGAAVGVVLVVAASAAGGVTAVAAPATATPARNLRRLTSGRGPFRAESFAIMELLPSAFIGDLHRRSSWAIVVLGRPQGDMRAGPADSNLCSDIIGAD